MLQWALAQHSRHHVTTQVSYEPKQGSKQPNGLFVFLLRRLLLTNVSLHLHQVSFILSIVTVLPSLCLFKGLCALLMWTERCAKRDRNTLPVRLHALRPLVSHKGSSAFGFVCFSCAEPGSLACPPPPPPLLSVAVLHGF